MEKTIFYNSSLPRAGSTLISNIIAQNPNFYCTPTSGLADLIINAKNTYNQSQAFQAQDKFEMEQSFFHYCKFGIQGYFNGITKKSFVLDKSREWGINYSLVEKWQINPKMICMVRDIRAIYASMEKNFRKNPHRENHIQNVPSLVGTTLDKRINIWADGAPVGISMDRLKDIHQQGLDKNILFIRYEDLMSNPEIEMKRIYNYFEIDHYQHNFEKISQLTNENDIVHGIYGDHILREKFEMNPNDFEEILGYEISQSIKNTYKWFFDKFGYV